MNRRDFLAVGAAVAAAPMAAAEAAEKPPESLPGGSSHQFWTGRRWLDIEEVKYLHQWSLRDENGRLHHCACGHGSFSSKEALVEAERAMREFTAPGLTRLHAQVEADPERLTIEYVLHMAEVQPPWIGDQLMYPNPIGTHWHDIDKALREGRISFHPGEF